MMMSRLRIGLALAVFSVSMHDGSATGGHEAKDVDMPIAPMKTPKLKVPTEAGPLASKFEVSKALARSKVCWQDLALDKYDGAGKIKSVSWVVGGLPNDSECSNHITAFLSSLNPLSPDFEAMAPVRKACLGAVSKIETIWGQIDAEDSINKIKSERVEIAVDGKELANLLGLTDVARVPKRMVKHIDDIHFNMEGFRTVTAWADMSHEFITGIKSEITLDEDAISQQIQNLLPHELRHVTKSSLSRAKLLTSDLLFYLLSATWYQAALFRGA